MACRQGARGFHGGPGYASTSYDLGYRGRSSRRSREAYDRGVAAPFTPYLTAGTPLVSAGDRKVLS